MFFLDFRHLASFDPKSHYGTKNLNLIWKQVVLTRKKDNFTAILDICYKHCNRFKILTKHKPQKLNQAPAPESWPNFSFQYLTKIQIFNLTWVSEFWPKFSFKILTKSIYFKLLTKLQLQYETVADVPESWVWWRADCQSGSRVLKHRKNCECCPGHYLIVDHYSSI